jgi:hypothetical protein
MVFAGGPTHRSRPAPWSWPLLPQCRRPSSTSRFGRHGAAAVRPHCPAQGKKPRQKKAARSCVNIMCAYGAFCPRPCEHARQKRPHRHIMLSIRHRGRRKKTPLRQHGQHRRFLRTAAVHAHATEHLPRQAGTLCMLSALLHSRPAAAGPRNVVCLKYRTPFNHHGKTA